MTYPVLSSGHALAPSIAALIHQTNAAAYYRRASTELHLTYLVMDPKTRAVRPHTETDTRTHRIRMQSLAARHSAAARRAMGVES